MIGRGLRELMRERVGLAPCTLPVSEAPCRIRLLTGAEIDEAIADAFAYITKLCRDRHVEVDRMLDVDPDAYECEKRRQILARAFYADDDTPALSVVTLRAFDSAYVQSLFERYVDHIDVHSTRRTLSDEAIDNLVEALALDEKERSPITTAMLVDLDRPTLARVIRTLALRMVARGGGAL